MKLIYIFKIIISHLKNEYSNKQNEIRYTRKILASIDHDQFSKLNQRYVSGKSKTDFKPGQYPYSRKYLDIDHYVREFVKFVLEFSLNDAPPFRVLDIGCGAGWLAYVLSFFGHSVEGIDTKDEVLRDIAEVLQVSRQETPVIAYKSLPIEGKFDLIVSKGAMFDIVNDID